MEILTTIYIICLLMTIIIMTQAKQNSPQLITTKQWKSFSYNFEPHAPLDDVNFFNPANILATGLAIAYDRIFIATPKLFSGVPSTLNFISKATVGDSPVLQAYPDWSFSSKDANCSDLVMISVYRFRVDTCNRLWVLDSGVSRSLEDYEVTCPPKILVFDLATNQVVRRIDFPREVLRGESLFTNLVIDETTSKTGTCDDVFVYISDTVEPGIVIYDSDHDVTWRVSHPAMYPDPDFAQSDILGYRFILMDGVVGLAFNKNSGVVYFQPLATDRVFSIDKAVLRKGPLAQNEVLQVKLVGKKSSQGIGLAVSNTDDSLLFSPLSETAIASWNPITNKQSVVAYDRERLQFVADISTSPYEPGVIYAVSSKFHRFFLKNLNQNEVNNRILRLELPLSSTYTRNNDFLLRGNVADVLKNPSYSHFKSFQYNSFFDNNVRSTSTAPLKNTLPTFSREQDPYNYETVAVVNYSLNNPLSSLNQGEAFPPAKELRNINQNSYLDRLTAETNGETLPT